MAFIPVHISSRDLNDNLLVGAKLFLYAADGVTPQASYRDGSGSTAHQNPVITNARGTEVAWIDNSQTYRLRLTDASEASVLYDQTHTAPIDVSAVFISPSLLGDQSLNRGDNVTFASAQVGDRPDGDDTDYAANTRFVQDAIDEVNTAIDAVELTAEQGLDAARRVAKRTEYTTQAEFLAGTSDGQYGYVVEQLFLNSAGSAVLQVEDEATRTFRESFLRNASAILSLCTLNPTGDPDHILVDKTAGTVYFPRMTIDPNRRAGFSSRITINGSAGLTLPLEGSANLRVYFVDLDDPGAGVQSDLARSLGQTSESVLTIGTSASNTFAAAIGITVKIAEDLARTTSLEGKRSQLVSVSPTTTQSRKVITNADSGTVTFPRLLVQPHTGSSFQSQKVIPGKALTLSLTDVATYYYIDLSTNTIEQGARSQASDTDTRLYLGSSSRGALALEHGIPISEATVDERLATGGNTQALREDQIRLPVITETYGSRQPFVFNTQKWRDLPCAHPNQTVQMNNGAKVNLENIIVGSGIDFIVTSGTAQIYAGEGRNFVGQSHNLVTVTGPAIGRIVSFNADAVGVDLGVGSEVYSTVSAPTMDNSVLLAGQSLAQLFGLEGGPGGFSTALQDTDWLESAINEDVYWIHGATGGSFVDRRGTTSSNYWWDPNLSQPGPALTTCVNAISAAVADGQPAPDVVFWNQGQAEIGPLRNGLYTPAQYQASIQAIFDYIRANGAPNADFVISMLGAEDDAVRADGAILVREAYHAVIAANSWCHFGPETYDLPRGVGEVHTTAVGNFVYGRRFARHWANLTQSQTNTLEPVITSVARDASGGFVTVTVDFLGDGRGWPPGNTRENVSTGLSPMGFGLINPVSGDDIPITRAEVTGNFQVTLYGDNLPANVIVIHPYGLVPNARKGDYIATDLLDRYTSQRGLPLRAFRGATSS